MGDENEEKESQPPKPARIPALFATIHFRSEQRPDGYTDEEIVRLNELANGEHATDGDAS
jgi:hypothetical protein